MCENRIWTAEFSFNIGMKIKNQEKGIQDKAVVGKGSGTTHMCYNRI